MPRWSIIAGLVALLVAGGATALLVSGGEEASAQTVRFQQPTDSGPDPFTRPADTRGSSRVRLGSGPFGGTGSDLVCDRELLIRSLIARPDRLRAWAGVVGIEPTPAAVSSYIRSLKAVTLTRDTRITNHSYSDGEARPFQSILRAGTAVLVDKDGKPVVRCRCGNPLAEPEDIKVAECLNCPPRYRPPPPCEYYDYDDSGFTRLDDREYLRTYRPVEYRGKCYVPYPTPPPAKPPDTPPPGGGQPGGASASFSPSSGQAGDTFTLSASGFEPNRTLEVTLTRPDGVTEEYEITTDDEGNGSRSFPGDPSVVTGTYSAVVRDPESGDEATASAEVGPADGEDGSDGQQPNCEAPQSQAEFELCQQQQQQGTPDGGEETPPADGDGGQIEP